MSSKTALLIPCFNEESCIAAVIESITRKLPDVYLLVVNDASTDYSAGIIRKIADRNDHVVLLDLPVNLGIGGAVQTAFRYAAKNDFDYAVKVDGDGQHPVDQICKLLAPLQAGEADMVIGSRFLEKKGFQSTFYRRIGINFFRILNSFLTGRCITDNTSGFRAYNREALLFCEKHYPSFDYPEPEEVVLMVKNHFRVQEVAVQMACRQGGRSCISPLKAVYYMLKVCFSVLMASIRPAVRSKDIKK